MPKIHNPRIILFNNQFYGRWKNLDSKFIDHGNVEKTSGKKDEIEMNKTNKE
jgi:hypothetical protein